MEGREEYLRLTGEGHPTDGETAKHTLPAHHIDLPYPPAAEQPVFERGYHHLRGRRGGGGSYGPNQMKTSGGRERRRGGATPMLTAHRQIMKEMNEHRKLEKMKKGKRDIHMTRNAILNQKNLS